jgi:arsenate reductase
MSAVLNVLFLCTGNSARSVLAECLLNARGAGRFRAFSAGSHPTGRVNPFALDVLAAKGISSVGVRSKRWIEFAGRGAPVMDLIVTVCDDAAGESCPVWPGHPVTAHWGLPDPAAVHGSDDEKRQAFAETLAKLEERIAALLALPIPMLDRDALRQALKRIGDR